MNKDYTNKIITLSDGYQYVILEETVYNGKNYALANDIVNGKLGENITLYRVEYLNNEPNFIVEQDLDVVETVLSKLSN